MKGSKDAALSLYNLVLPKFAENPYPFYHELRMSDPVHWDRTLQSWVVTRYCDVVAGLLDPRLSEERVIPFLDRLVPKEREKLAPLARALSRMMVFVDPPDHTRLRGLVNKAFAPRIVEGLRPYIQRQIDDLLERVLPTGRMDVIGDFAAPLSASVIAEMLLIPQEDRGQFREWTGLIRGFFACSERDIEHVMTLRDCFERLLAQRRANPGDDLLTALINVREHDDRFTDDEIFSTFLLLFDAGQVTTTNLIGNGMLALLRHPEQLAELRDQPKQLASAVTEFMRFDSPVQFTSRIAKEDLAIDGRKIAKGQNVTLVLAAANRDPAQFPDPDRLDLSRSNNRQLGFGYGLHYCLGAALALVEAQMAIGALLRHMTALRLAPGTQLKWHDSINFRFLKALPILFEPTKSDA